MTIIIPLCDAYHRTPSQVKLSCTLNSVFFYTKPYIMTIQVNAPFKVSDNLQALIEEKVEKLSTFFERIQSAEVFLRDEENSNQQDPRANTVELRLHVPGNTLYADFSADTFEKALAETTEKMRRQLIKHKEKISSF